MLCNRVAKMFEMIHSLGCCVTVKTQLSKDASRQEKSLALRLAPHSDFLNTQKRPTTDTKETYYRRKRDL